MVTIPAEYVSVSYLRLIELPPEPFPPKRLLHLDLLAIRLVIYQNIEFRVHSSIIVKPN